MASRIPSKGALGLKQPKPPKAPRKPIPRISARKKAHKAAERKAGAQAHMDKVAQQGCLICGARPVELHHEGKPRSDFNVLPLCPPHHRREFGPGAYHYSPSAFYALHGTSEELLARVAALLQIHGSASV